jgi:hypothetical protein
MKIGCGQLWRFIFLTVFAAAPVCQSFISGSVISDSANRLRVRSRKYLTSHLLTLEQDLGNEQTPLLSDANHGRTAAFHAASHVIRGCARKDFP